MTNHTGRTKVIDYGREDVANRNQREAQTASVTRGRKMALKGKGELDKEGR